MTDRHRELIALLLGDDPADPALARWLATTAGRRELAAYRRTLQALDRHWGPAEEPVPAAWYGRLDTPIGPVLVATTETGLVRLSFRRREADFVAELRRRLAGEVVRSEARTAGALRQLRDYFAGRRRTFDVPIDLARLTTPFQRRVLAATAGVRAGQVVSYGEIARRVGRPRGSRAVGQALGRNPIPIVIPCHRVVASGGRLGGYTGGLGVKRKLLLMEGAASGRAPA
jgi:methylated-DNA-[protein]-cysteine S-methyltransferase